MGFDLTSWGIKAAQSVNLERTKECLRALKEDGISAPADHVHTKLARAATIENITLSGLQTIDNVSLIENNTVLVKNQSDPRENGLYQVKTTAWERNGFTLLTDVSEGAINSGTTWLLHGSDHIVLGTSSLTYGIFTTFTIGEIEALSNNATAQATIITQKAAAAKSSETAAAGSAQDALASKNAAGLSETNAKTSETNSAESAASALSDKNSAQASATSAAQQALLAQTNGLYLPADNLTITYNADGTVNTVSNGSITKRITYANGVATAVTTV